MQPLSTSIAVAVFAPVYSPSRVVAAHSILAFAVSSMVAPPVPSNFFFSAPGCQLKAPLPPARWLQNFPFHPPVPFVTGTQRPSSGRLVGAGGGGPKARLCAPPAPIPTTAPWV